MYKQIISDIRKGNYTIDNVKQAADMILSVEKSYVPVKIIEICKNMGFRVYQQDLPNEVCGYIAIDGELKERFSTDRIIAVNSNESSKRRRFTVAHELAHFLFEFNPSKSIQFYNAFELDHMNTTSEVETLANRFAAELLMPSKQFSEKYKEIFQKYSNSNEYFYEVVQDLSDLFLVPPKAVEMRIRKELVLYE